MWVKAWQPPCHPHVNHAAATVAILPSPVRHYTADDVQHPAQMHAGYDPHDPAPDVNTRLAFRYENEGEDAVIKDLVVEADFVSDNDPWKNHNENQLHRSFTEQKEMEFDMLKNRLIDLESLKIPQARTRSASVPNLKSDSDSEEEVDPKKLLQNAFKLPGHGYFDRQLKMLKGGTKRFRKP